MDGGADRWWSVTILTPRLATLLATCCLVAVVQTPAVAEPGRFDPVRPVVPGLSAGDLVGMSRADVEERLDVLDAAHTQSIRVDFSWASVQPTSIASWNWGNIDDIVRAAQRRGLAVLPVIGYTPWWAREGDCKGERCAPRDVDEFAVFAAAAAERYASVVDTWEIWNEPNTGAWRDVAAVPGYANLLRATYAAIRREQPDAAVLVGGLAPTETIPQVGVAPEDFLAELYHFRAASSFDGVAVHPYSFPALPGEPEEWSGWSQMLRLREVMVAAGDADKGVWITEMGAPTGGIGVAATLAERRYALAPQYVDEALQARTVQATFAAARILPWVRAVYWYGLVDLPAEGASNEGYFGLLHADGTPKPAYGAWLREVSAPMDPHL